MAESFTAGTKVLLATGAAVPIAKLKRGQKVLATNTRTGKTHAEPITAVLVHHDTNRYNLTIHTPHGTAVIHTTRTHLFWAPTTHRWIKAAALHHGTHLATPGIGAVTVAGGHNPRDKSGWMWDLTIRDDHDFYIQAAATAILVHNINSFDCSDEGMLARLPAHSGGETSGIFVDEGAQTRLTSGLGGPASHEPSGTPGFNLITRTYVEGNAAAIMRQQGLDEATLYTNNAPCLGVQGCDYLLPRMLPEGAKLRVLAPGFGRTYTGLPDNFVEDLPDLLAEEP